MAGLSARMPVSDKAKTASGVGAREVRVIRSLAMAGELPRINVSGDSMRPWLHEPMTLELGPVIRLRIGDIIVFCKDGYLVAHRLVGRRNDVYYACGDARPWAIEEVRAGELAGKVVAVYESADRQARRVDDWWFIARGVVFARGRAVRVAAHRLPMSLHRLARGLNAPGRPRGFVALVEAVSAALCDDPRRFAAALALTDPGAFLAAARRHRCSEIVRKEMVARGIADPSGGRLTRALQSSTRETGLGVLGLRQQINELVVTLNRAQVKFALLKGAARIYPDAPDADYHRSVDLDILVPRAQLDAGRAALLAAGYREKVSEQRLDFYRRYHHHSAPLFPHGRGVSVELHVELAPRGTLKETLDWEYLAAHMCTVSGPMGDVRCLDDFASALNLATHSIGIKRLRDIYLLACILRRSDASLGAQLMAFAGRQGKSRVLLEGVLALAARLARLQWSSSPRVASYLRWVMRREDMPIYMRRRSQVIEAWHADGGKLFGPSFKMINQLGTDVPTAATSRARARLFGRVLIAGFAALYTASMRPPKGASGDALLT